MTEPSLDAPLGGRFSDLEADTELDVGGTGLGRPSTASTCSARESTLLDMLLRCSVNVSEVRHSFLATPVGLAWLAVGEFRWE